MLVAQAAAERGVVASADEALRPYSVAVLW